MALVHRVQCIGVEKTWQREFEAAVPNGCIHTKQRAIAAAAQLVLSFQYHLEPLDGLVLSRLRSVYFSLSRKAVTDAPRGLSPG